MHMHMRAHVMQRIRYTLLYAVLHFYRRMCRISRTVLQCVRVRNVPRATRCTACVAAFSTDCSTATTPTATL